MNKLLIVDDDTYMRENIVETGTHKELLSKNGVYADIYHSQFAQKHAKGKCRSQQP